MVRVDSLSLTLFSNYCQEMGTCEFFIPFHSYQDIPISIPMKTD